MMVIKYSKNGIDMDEQQKEIERLLLVLGEDPDNEEAYSRLIKLYEEVSNYDPNCNVCIVGRNLFINGLRKMKEGENLEALANFRGAMRSVNFKWKRFTSKLGF